jgi:hypothetical protein
LAAKNSFFSVSRGREGGSQEISHEQGVSRDIKGVPRDAFSPAERFFSLKIKFFSSEVRAFLPKVRAFCYKLRAFLFNHRPFLIPVRCMQTCTFMVDMAAGGKIARRETIKGQNRDYKDYRITGIIDH